MGAALCNPRPAPASAVPSLRRASLTDRADSPSLAHSALSAASLPLRPGRHAPFGAPDGAQHLAFKSLFLFFVWRCLYGRKLVCEDSGWLKKTEDRNTRQKHKTQTQDRNGFWLTPRVQDVT